MQEAIKKNEYFSPIAERSAGIVDANNDIGFDQLIYEEAKRRGIFTGSARDFWLYHRDLKDKSRADYKNKVGDAQDTDLVKKEILALVQTFGIDEPSFLESLGPAEISRLQALPKATFMFLGCAGDISAAEFDHFSKGINPQVRQVITEIQPKKLDQFNKDRGQNFVGGDVLNLPFAEESADLICTDHLLDELSAIKKSEEDGVSEIIRLSTADEHIAKMLQETWRVLKTGGSLVMVEQLYGEARKKFNIARSLPLKDKLEIEKGSLRRAMEGQIGRLAEQAGFSQVDYSDYYSYAYRADAASAEIDSQGVAHYGKALLIKDDKIYLVARLVK